MKRALAVALGLCLAAPAFSQQVGPVHRSVLRDPSPAFRILDRTINDAAFTDAPLERVMDWIAETSGVTVEVRWAVLEAQGIGRDLPISIRIRNVRLSQVLSLVLTQAGGDVSLEYHAGDNLIVVSTRDNLSRDMIVRVYDVSDLLARAPRFANAARLNLSQALGQGNQGGGVSVEEFGASPRDEPLADQGGTPEMRQLIYVIINTIEPDSWRANTATASGSIIPLRNTLVVRSSLRVHQQLGGFLSEVAGP